MRKAAIAERGAAETAYRREVPSLQAEETDAVAAYLAVDAQLREARHRVDVARGEAEC